MWVYCIGNYEKGGEAVAAVVLYAKQSILCECCQVSTG